MKLRNILTLFQWMNFARNWWVPVLVNFGLWKSKEVEIKRRDGSSVCFPYLGKFTAVGMISEIFFYKVYEHPLFIPKNGWKVIDIGANFGTFVLWCQSHAEGCFIEAYEPIKRNFDYLVKNTKGGLVIQHKKAVSDKKGKVRIYHSKDCDNAHSMYDSWTRNPDAIYENVDSVTLETILYDIDDIQINLLKIDCEGAEYPIIMKSKDSLFGWIDRIIVEYHAIEGHSEEKLIKRLEKLEYAMVKRQLDRFGAGSIMFFIRRDLL